jgi:hypothetical protein
MNYQPEFHERFTRDPKYHWHTWKPERPILKSLHMKYHLCEGYCSIRKNNVPDTITVTAHLEEGNSIGSFHENCWNYVIENATTIERELRRKLWPLCKENFDYFIQCVKSDNPAWLEARNATDWNSPSSLDLQVSFEDITIFDDGFDETGFCIFSFEVPWDPEHGCSILMHKDRVIAVGQYADFLVSTPDLVPIAKELQKHNFTEGDFQFED